MGEAAGEASLATYVVWLDIAGAQCLRDVLAKFPKTYKIRD